MADQTTTFFGPQGQLKDVPASKISEALASGGQRAILFTAPDGKQKWVPQSRAKEALQNGGFVANASDLTIHTGEGTYKMSGPGGKPAPVPYSLVGSAAKIGWTMDPSDRETYIRDAAADPNLNVGAKLPQGVKRVGRNTAGQPMLGEDNPAPSGSAVGRFLGEAGSTIGGAVSGMSHAVTEGPQNPEEAKAVSEFTNPAVARVGLILDRLLAQPFVQTLDLAQSQKKDTAYGKLAADLESASTAALAVVPGVGPWIAQSREQAAEKIGAGDYAGGAGALAGNALLAAAPEMARPLSHLLGRAVTSLPEGVRTQIRDTLGVSDKSEDLIEKFGKESDKVRDANKKIEIKNSDARRESIEAHRQAEKEHAEQADEARKHNNDVLRDRKKRADTEQKLEKAAKEFDEKIDAAKKDANQKNDAAWDAWRDKVAGQEISSAPIVNEIKEIKSAMDPEDVAEFRRILKESEVADADRSEVQKLQDEIAKRNLGADSYESLTPEKKLAVDDIISRLNLKPEEMEAEPEAPTGAGAGTGTTSTGGAATKPIDARRLHVWKTQLEYAIREATRRNVKYGIGRVLDKVRAAESELSKQAGAEKELETARTLHGPYVDTFRNSQTTPNTAANYVRSRVTPNFVKDDKLEGYIGQLGGFDPSIPKLAEHIENLQDGLKALPKDRPLREQIQQLPPPVEPRAKAEQEPLLKFPDGTNVQPDTVKTLSRNLRRFGKIGGWVLRSIVGGEALHIAHGSLSAFGSTMLLGQTAVTILTHALRSQSVLEWLAKPSVEDLKAIEQLKPEDQARLRQALAALASEEVSKQVKKNIPAMNPAIAKFMLGFAATQNPNAKELRKRADQINAPLPAQHSSAQPSYTHIYDPNTGAITAVR